MKKVFVFLAVMALSTSCAELFCDMFNYSKENDKDRFGAGDDIFAVDVSDVNAYVTCKSGWSAVDWTYPHNWTENNDYPFRPRFLPQEAVITPYPDEKKPLVYICQYPEVTETHIEAHGYRETKEILIPHCATWEIIAADKRVFPLLMTGEGFISFTEPRVIELLDEYVKSIESLKTQNMELSPVLAETWENFHAISKRIIACKTSSLSVYDPGYSIKGRWWDKDFWSPQWQTRSDKPWLDGGIWHKRVETTFFYAFYNSFDHNSYPVPYPLKDAAESLFGKFPVDGYKYGIHYFLYLWMKLDDSIVIDEDNDLVIYNPDDLDLEKYIYSEVETNYVPVTLYCILPEHLKTTQAIWCVNPEDWK